MEDDVPVAEVTAMAASGRLGEAVPQRDVPLPHPRAVPRGSGLAACVG